MAALVITERQVLFSYVTQKLSTKYLEKSSTKTHRGTRQLEDIFADFGYQVDQSTPEKAKKFIPLVLHFQRLVEKYQKAYHSKKDEELAIQSITTENKVFYSKPKHPKLEFLQPTVHM